MVRMLEAFGERLLGLIVPETQAAACECRTLPCAGGGERECCKFPGYPFMCGECS